MRGELIAPGIVEVEGAAYSAMIAEAARCTLDANAVRAEMGDAWWNARCRQSRVTTVAIKSRAIVESAVRADAVKLAA